jgi:hypothetical protein
MQKTVQIADAAMIINKPASNFAVFRNYKTADAFDIRNSKSHSHASTNTADSKDGLLVFIAI